MNKSSAMEFGKKLIAGVFIGIGAIIPGVSGGVIAVAMGVYERMINAISHFFSSPKENFMFLLPLGLGAGIGLLAFSRLVVLSMKYLGDQIIFLFIGLVIGGIPSLFKTANSKGFKPRYILALLFGIAAILMPTKFELIAQSIQKNSAIDFGTGFISGVILALGTIAPGINTSFILMYIGTYEGVMEAISALNISVLFPVCLGFGVSALLIIKVVSFLFKRFYSYSYYTVLGFLVGSIVLIIPPLRFNLTLLLNILVLLLGCASAYFFERGRGHSKV